MCWTFSLFSLTMRVLEGRSTSDLGLEWCSMQTRGGGRLHKGWLQMGIDQGSEMNTNELTSDYKWEWPRLQMRLTKWLHSRLTKEAKWIQMRVTEWPKWLHLELTKVVKFITIQIDQVSKKTTLGSDQGSEHDYQWIDQVHKSDYTRNWPRTTVEIDQDYKWKWPSDQNDYIRNWPRLHMGLTKEAEWLQMKLTMTTNQSDR